MTSTQLYTGDPARLATAHGSAPPSPAARAPSHLRSDGRRAGERQPGTRPGGTCANRGALAAPRTAAAGGSPRRPRGTHEGARRTVHRGRPARLRPTTPRRCGSCAAALVTTTTIACQVVDSRARYHRVQMATIAERGANAGTARRARDGRRAYPANRHRVCIRTRSCVRRLTISIAIGAAFGYDTRAHALSRTLTRREASQWSVRRSPSGARVATWCHAVASWCHWGASWCDNLVSPV